MTVSTFDMLSNDYPDPLQPSSLPSGLSELDVELVCSVQQCFVCFYRDSPPGALELCEKLTPFCSLSY